MKHLAEIVSRVFADGRAKIILLPDREDGDMGIKVDITEARSVMGYIPQYQLEKGLLDLGKRMKEINK